MHSVPFRINTRITKIRYQYGIDIACITQLDMIIQTLEKLQIKNPWYFSSEHKQLYTMNRVTWDTLFLFLFYVVCYVAMERPTC